MVSKYEEALEPSGPKATAHKVCSCVSPFQDKRYGTRIRVHNRMVRKVSSNAQWRCTVCGKER